MLAEDLYRLQNGIHVSFYCFDVYLRFYNRSFVGVTPVTEA